MVGCNECTDPATATKISARLADVNPLTIRENVTVSGIMANSLFRVSCIEYRINDAETRSTEERTGASQFPAVTRYDLVKCNPSPSLTGLRNCKFGLGHRKMGFEEEYY
jgi:hypothetical protein